MADQLAAIALVIAMARDFSIETRIRRLLHEHEAAGDRPRTLVMNVKTWHQLVSELEDRTYSGSYFWSPNTGVPMAPAESVTSFYGLPILIKEYIADELILVGV